MVKPERRDSGETEKAYSAFLKYCDTKPDRRVLSDFAKQNKLVLRSVKNWHGKNSWEERVKAWDEPIFEAKQKAQIEYEVASNEAVWAARDKAKEAVSNVLIPHLIRTLTKRGGSEIAKIQAGQLLIKLSKYEDIAPPKEKVKEEDLVQDFSQGLKDLLEKVSGEDKDHLIRILEKVSEGGEGNETQT